MTLKLWEIALMHGIKKASCSGDTTLKNNTEKGKDMEFLKEILGEELFNQVKEKLDAHNGDEANKDNQIKIGNLGRGEYVSSSKYSALQETLNGKDAEITNANNLIAELKKASKGNEEMQQKFSDYEAENLRLQEELHETKLKSAIKVALLSEKAVDVDYLTFKLNEKLKEKGEVLELDENDNIKNWDDKLSGLKTQFPTMFESSDKGDYKVFGNNKLPKGEEKNILTKSELLKKPYAERQKIFEENPEAYKAAMNS